jgi:hypothetical protein
VICSIRFFLSFILLLAASCLVAAPPVPFSGKLAVDGKNFHGNARFAFSIVDGEGAVHWKHAQENNATIENFVLNGRYLSPTSPLPPLPMPSLPSSPAWPKKPLLPTGSPQVRSPQG